DITGILEARATRETRPGLGPLGRLDQAPDLARHEIPIGLITARRERRGDPFECGFLAENANFIHKAPNTLRIGNIKLPGESNALAVTHATTLERRNNPESQQ